MFLLYVHYSRNKRRYSSVQLHQANDDKFYQPKIKIIFNLDCRICNPMIKLTKSNNRNAIPTIYNKRATTFYIVALLYDLQLAYFTENISAPTGGTNNILYHSLTLTPYRGLLCTKFGISS